jgi:hypothetical protein
MEILRIKFRRSDDYSLESYGEAVHRAFDDLAGGKDKWDTTSSHGLAKLGRTKAEVERHEDGPEIVGLVLNHLPDYIGAITGLVALWWSRPRNKKKGSTSLSISVGEFKMDAPLDDPEAVRRAIYVLRSFSRKRPRDASSRRPHKRGGV